MRSIRKILLLCLAYNIVGYALIFLYDLADEHMIDTSFPCEELAMVVLFILMPLSVIVAELLGFSRDFSRNEILVYAIVWAAASIIIMFTFGEYGLRGGFIKQVHVEMLNGIEYYLPGVCIGVIMPVLYLLLRLIEELYARFKKRRSDR